MARRLDSVRIVLVEPAGGLNVGAIARVMANMGLSQLVLVNPQCDPLGDDALLMAVHADGLLRQARQVDDLPTALAGCQRAIATTARTRAEMTLESPEAALPWLIDQVENTPVETALIFGPESRGLSNSELNYAQRYVMISSDSTYPSLNLAQAVAVCSYVLRRSALSSMESTVDPSALSPRFKRAQGPEQKNRDADLGQVGQDKSSTGSLSAFSAELSAATAGEAGAALEQIDGYFQHLESVLLKIGYLYPHTAASRLEKLRRLLYKAHASEQELAMLRGILRQVEWALSQAAADH